ncbi:hypothetical protein SNOG_06698 [Parastagonospora nodorum SN15]|uniref:Uncharacterized protein n=1 Tax=Phaeosphaeria nodorum (strain SN15 / ATCC MYA-4574 / FGSC 10173) TaxID=321614 RepID=Q0UNG6_PHANO|nr:hypothetical protein SNOG_06698 [Parastagonospora nodorum SN15]EAT85349.2 hypothetical protein SNOG_06698 [Parastagonospora nodorum SN15]
MAVPDASPAFQFLVSRRIPPELVLKTIQHLPFEDGKRIASLRLIPGIKDLVKTYEHSITSWFMKKELRHALVDFPYGEKFGLKWLADCVSRYDVVDAVMDELTWRENCVAVEPHNVAAVNAGLLLLYRLASIPLYLALHHATLTARYHGHGWIHQRTYGRFMDANQLSLRNELEFCFAEATLSVGPVFLYDMLVNPSDPQGEITLLNFYHEHGTHDWEWPCWGVGKGEFEPPRTQGPQREDKGRSLFTGMLERMAELEKCSLAEVRSRIEEKTDATEHDLAFLSLDGKANVIQGLDVDFE